MQSGDQCLPRVLRGYGQGSLRYGIPVCSDTVCYVCQLGPVLLYFPNDQTGSTGYIMSNFDTSNFH